jgi:hypothetical protein
MLKLDPVTGRKTLRDTLTDAACTSHFEVIPKIDINFPYLENSNMSPQLNIIELKCLHLCIFADCTCVVWALVSVSQYP